MLRVEACQKPNRSSIPDLGSVRCSFPLDSVYARFLVAREASECNAFEIWWSTGRPELLVQRISPAHARRHTARAYLYKLLSGKQPCRSGEWSWEAEFNKLAGTPVHLSFEPSGLVPTLLRVSSVELC